MGKGINCTNAGILLSVYYWVLYITCDFSGERESVAARESAVGRSSDRPTLALPHFRAPPLKRTPDDS